MIRILRIIFFVLLVITLIALPFFIKVRLECKSQYGDCPPEVVSGLKAEDNKNVFVAKNKSAELLKKNYLVSKFSMQFKLPDIILINLIVKKPYYALKIQSTGTFELVGADGVILADEDSTALPAVMISEEPKPVGAKVSDENLFALKLISGIFQMYQIGYGTIVNDTLVVDMPTSVRVIFPLTGADADVLLGGLRLIYTKVTTDYPGVYSQIDMRYKNPILR